MVCGLHNDDERADGSPFGVAGWASVVNWSLEWTDRRHDLHRVAREVGVVAMVIERLVRGPSLDEAEKFAYRW